MSHRVRLPDSLLFQRQVVVKELLMELPRLKLTVVQQGMNARPLAEVFPQERPLFLNQTTEIPQIVCYQPETPSETPKSETNLNTTREIDDAKPAAGLQDAIALAEHRRNVLRWAEVMERVNDQNPIQRLIIERQLQGGSLVNMKPRIDRQLPGDGDIHAVQVAKSHGVERVQGFAIAAAEIQDARVSVRGVQPQLT